ncbi:unnamed protein product [Heligmosomoides polygyrus]|uniref:S ribonuclease n=1 Tax=Heligmosomoides polygyrus TaxID=6339 RepID=A0A183FJM8_HELPZ|nr:unnamed protein product [Heligmosomoides polygyrus]
MFSEQYGRKGNDTEEMSRKKCQKTKGDEKTMTFDRLEDKLNEQFTAMTTKDREKGKDTKPEMKYSSAVQTERVKALSRGKTKSATAIVQKEKHLMAEHRSNSLEKQEQGDSVSHGLFDAANVMCNIVDISKDSTMRRRRSQESYTATQQPKPTKSSSKCEPLKLWLLCSLASAGVRLPVQGGSHNSLIRKRAEAECDHVAGVEKTPEDEVGE